MRGDALYQVAVGLIPALFFGGALLERRDDIIGTSVFGRRGTAFAVSALIVAGVFAEIMAIRGAIDIDISRFEQRFIVFVIVAGTVGIAMIAATPWVHVVVGARGSPLRRMLVIVIAIGGSVVAQLAITDSLDKAAARQEWEVASEHRSETADTLSVAVEEENQARAALIATADGTDPDARPRLVRVVTRHLDGLDDAISYPALSSASERQIEGAIDAAIDAIDIHDDGFSSDVDGVGVPPADHDLVRLAFDRLLSALMDRVVAEANAARAAHRFRAACDAARDIGCSIRSSVPAQGADQEP